MSGPPSIGLSLRLSLLDKKGTQWVANDSTHCKPYDEVKMNQWVRALTL